MAAHARYGWIIEIDHLEAGRVGRFGPRNIEPTILTRLAHPADDETDVKQWRCRDEDGELYYEGRFIGPEGRMHAPLEDFAMPDAGATLIEYLDAGGTWRSL